MNFYGRAWRSTACKDNFDTDWDYKTIHTVGNCAAGTDLATTLPNETKSFEADCHNLVSMEGDGRTDSFPVVLRLVAAGSSCSVFNTGGPPDLPVLIGFV
jgi:hypothetical protein